ncbi:MAG: DNA double-strand break repair nuclease NurA [Armatimonadetes bacterium]|nr:DNA double-strand break repair nuclease NurA [Armatimonadota bacterium]
MFKLNEVYARIADLAEQQLVEQADRARRREHTVAAYADHARRYSWWADRTATAGTKLQLAALTPEAGRSFPAPPAPLAYTVVASDGSQIYPDRHGAAIWFVVNTGRVRLTYGEQSSAELDSEPRLYSDEGDVFRGVLGQRQTVTAEHVAVVRTVEELRALLALAEATTARPAVALLDGKLIPWSWAHEDDGFTLAHLEEYGRLLARFGEIGVPVASYVSRSGANEVNNLVRLGDCDQRVVNCELCPHLAAVRQVTGSDTMTVAEAQALPCGRPAGLVDSDLFGAVLPASHRSPLFVERNSGYERIKQRAAFFYLHAARDGAAREIGRVEMPEWAADDESVVSLVHAVIVDQIAKGHGYPVALQEAHEQAIVRGPDRAAFVQLLERELVRGGMPVTHSLKARSKQVPGV